LRIQGAGVGYKPGIISEIGKKLSEKNINIYSIITSQTCINLIIDRNDSEESLRCLKSLEGGVIEKVEKIEDMALVAVVGEGISRREGIAGRVFSAVAREGVNIEMMSGGASEVAYYFIIKEEPLEKVINAVHSEFF
jgi:aspartokinase